MQPTTKEEWDRLVDLRTSGNEREYLLLRNEILVRHLGIVTGVANEILGRLPKTFHRDKLHDLESAGSCGLIRAIERFIPGRGNSFRSFAIFAVRGAMLDWLRQMDWIPKHVRRKHRDDADGSLPAMVLDSEVSDDDSNVAKQQGAADELPGLIRREAMVEALARLDPVAREIVILKAVAKLGDGSVGRIVGVSPKTVKSWYKLARRLLAARLGTP